MRRDVSCALGRTPVARRSAASRLATIERHRIAQRIGAGVRRGNLRGGGNAGKQLGAADDLRARRIRAGAVHARGLETATFRIDEPPARADLLHAEKARAPCACPRQSRHIDRPATAGWARACGLPALHSLISAACERALPGQSAWTYWPKSSISGAPPSSTASPGSVFDRLTLRISTRRCAHRISHRDADARARARPAHARRPRC